MKPVNGVVVAEFPVGATPAVEKVEKPQPAKAVSKPKAEPAEKED